MTRRHVAGAIGLALGGMSVAIAVGSPAYTFAGSLVGAITLLMAGWSLVLAGFVFWRARPGNPVGPLLVVAGAAWFVAEWDNRGVASSAIFTIGLVLHAACPVLVALVMFRHPAGQIAGWPERVGVATLAVGAVLLFGVLTATSLDTRAAGCQNCPDNLVLVDGNIGRASDFAQAGIRVSLVAGVGLIVAAGWRLLRSSSARRTLIAPGLLAGSLYLGAVGWTFAANADRAFIGSGPLERRLWFAQAGALVLFAGAVVWGRVRSNRTRRSLVDVVVALGKSYSAGGLREALSRRLADPELQIGYVVGDARWADLDGAGVDVTANDTRATTPLLRDGEPVAVIVHRPGLLDDPDLVAEVTSSARLLLDNERFRAGVRAREADLRASRARIVASGDAERRRLERDLHDSAQQRLVGLLLGVRLARARSDDEQLRRVLGDAEHELALAVDSLREVAHGIHPAALTTFGLREALRSLGERTGTEIEVHGLPSERLPPEVEAAVYQVVATAAAKGAASVQAERLEGRLRIDVVTESDPDQLVELEDRVGALDGWVRVERDEGEAIHVRSEIPCAS